MSFGPSCYHSIARPQAVWQSLEALPSFGNAGETPKLGRWFSWNTQAKQAMTEYHAQKMVFEFVYGDTVADPDLAETPFDDLQAAAGIRAQNTSFQALKASQGGLKFAYMLMTTQLLENCRIMYVATKASWSWYTDQVKNIKNPNDQVKYLLEVSRASWQRDSHFADTIRLTLYDKGQLEFMGITASNASADKLIARALDLMLHLLSRRVWSMAARHGVPPDEYAGLLSANVEEQAAVVLKMSRSMVMSCHGCPTVNETQILWPTLPNQSRAAAACPSASELGLWGSNRRVQS